MEPIFHRFSGHVPGLEPQIPKKQANNEEKVEKIQQKYEFIGQNTSKYELLVVQATSAGFDAGNFAKIYVNDKVVDVWENQSQNMRGLHVVTIDPKTGELWTGNCFDTYLTSSHMEKAIEKIPKGYIVVAACKDECSRNLSMSAKLFFAYMGSEEIWNIKYRQAYAFIGINGKKSGCHEKRAWTKDEPIYTAQVFYINKQHGAKSQEEFLAQNSQNENLGKSGGDFYPAEDENGSNTKYEKQAFVETVSKKEEL